MQNASSNFERSLFFTYSWLAVLFLFPTLSFAQTTDKQSIVVVVSMYSQNSALYWHEGEARIMDELQMSNLNVKSTIGSPYASLNMQEALKTAASTEQADVAISLFRTNDQTARLMVYTQSAGTSDKPYSEYDFTIATNEDAVEIVSLKTAEVVHEAVNKTAEPTPMPDLPKPTKQPMAPRLKLALGLAIAGGVMVAAGGVFHWLDYRNGWDYYDLEELKKDRLLIDLNEDDIRKEIKRERFYNWGAALGYSISSILLITSASIFFKHQMMERKKDSSLKLSIRGIGVTLEF